MGLSPMIEDSGAGGRGLPRIGILLVVRETEQSLRIRQMLEQFSLADFEPTAATGLRARVVSARRAFVAP